MVEVYKLYQIKDTRNTSYAFCGLHYNFKPIKSDYQLVYDGVVGGDNIYQILESLFELFNLNHPKDFKGRSMSVSDVVIIGEKAYYCDSMGFAEIDFN